MGENPTAHEAAENRSRSSVMCRWEEKKKKTVGGSRGDERHMREERKGKQDARKTE